MKPLYFKVLRPDGPTIMPPAYRTDGASGMDLHAIESVVIYPGRTEKIAIGIAVEIPPGFEGQIRPRSSLSAQGILCHFGTIDSDYRGEIAVVLTNLRQANQIMSLEDTTFTVSVGDRIAQLVIAPVERVTPVLSRVLSTTVRGEGGFGHTGR